MSKTPEEIYRDQVGSVSRELFELHYELAKAYVELERVRKDRTGPPEKISDAASKYRELERATQKKSSDLVSLHCKMLAKNDPPQ